MSEPVVTATVDDPVPVEDVPAATSREQLLEEALIALADFFAKGMGDLRRPVTLGSDDPAVRRAEADVQAFVDQVRHMRMQMEEMTAQASMAAATSGHQMGAVAGTMAESHSQLEQAAQGVEQSQTGVSEVARAAASTAALAEEAEQRTSQGAATIQHAIASIGEIQADIQIARDKVGALATRSEQISRVSALIDGIAQRTNLLALNAAIEAARAGQHGRGFGVVAEEIRRLAESTAGQTREIRGLITAISVDLKETEAAIEGSKVRADQGVAQAAEAGQALVEIQDLVKRATEPVTEIAGLAEEQSAALEQVTASLQEMSRGIGAVSNQAKKVGEVTANLAGITEQGYSVLNRFNCGSLVDILTEAGRGIVKDVQGVLEGVVDSGQVSLRDLLSFEYFEYKGHHIQKLKRLMGDVSKAPLDGFTPPKFGTAYDSLVDVELRDLLDRHLEATKGIGFLVLSDLNGYSPAQNKRYCQPWTGDEKIDFHSRVKRMNCDCAQVRGSRMGLNWVEREPLEIGVATDYRNPRTIHTRQEFLAAGLNLTEPAGGDWGVLVQTFTRRLTGTVVNILSLPLYVKGERYGAVIVGWLPARNDAK